MEDLGPTPPSSSMSPLQVVDIMATLEKINSKLDPIHAKLDQHSAAIDALCTDRAVNPLKDPVKAKSKAY